MGGAGPGAVDPWGLIASSNPKKGGAPAAPAVPPVPGAPGPGGGTPLTPQQLGPGGLITFENHKGIIDHSAVYFEDPSCPSGYRAADMAPRGGNGADFETVDLIDFIRARDDKLNKETIILTPVKLDPKKGREAIDRYKADGKDYSSANKCTDCAAQLLSEAGSPHIDAPPVSAGGGETQIPEHLRDTIRKLEDISPGGNGRPEVVLPPGMRPPANPPPPAGPAPPAAPAQPAPKK